MKFSQAQFDALITYIDATTDMAVARARPPSGDYDDYGTLHESIRLREAREELEAVILKP